MMVVKKLSQSWQQQAGGDADKRQSTKVNDLLRSWQPLLRGGESTVYRRAGANVREDYDLCVIQQGAFSGQCLNSAKVSFQL